MPILNQLSYVLQLIEGEVWGGGVAEGFGDFSICYILRKVVNEKVG